MAAQDTSQIKEKIISFIKFGGPKLPVHIAKEIGLSILFSSAFLSELISEKKIKMSNMRVGSSPVYYIPGQEQKLESWASHLKSKEREAFEILKTKKILIDSEQEPAIRVALRAIKDFAVPFEKNNELYWRYFLEEEPRIQSIEKEEELPKKKSEEGLPKKETEEKNLGIFDSGEKASAKPKKEKSKKSQKKKPSKTNDKFFNKVKEFLAKKEIEIVDIESFSKKDIFLKIKDNSKEELLLAAYDKKRITEEDMLRAFKKSKELGLNYIILSTGETPKKIQEIIQASKMLSSLEMIE
jgi:hypothetical protein